MDLSINGKLVHAQGIKELDPTLTIKEASEKTQKNGIDEIYFTVSGKNYIAYGDTLDLKELKKNAVPSVLLNGKKGEVVTFEDENNSVLNGMGAGALDGLRSTRDIVTSAVGINMKSTATAGIVVAGGTVALTGFALAKGLVTKSPISNIIGDVMINGTLKAAGAAAITAAAGLALAVGTGAVVGAAESLSTEKNYASIASVTKDGSFKQPENTTPIEEPTPDPAPVDNTQPTETPSTQAIKYKAVKLSEIQSKSFSLGKAVQTK